MLATLPDDELYGVFSPGFPQFRGANQKTEPGITADLFLGHQLCIAGEGSGHNRLTRVLGGRGVQRAGGLCGLKDIRRITLRDQ